jgi:hypothetical protein
VSLSSPFSIQSKNILFSGLFLALVVRFITWKTGKMSKENKKILMLLQSDFPPDIRVEKEIKALSQAGYRISILSNNKKNRSSYKRIL